jgi:hypothetical protein
MVVAAPFGLIVAENETPRVPFTVGAPTDNAGGLTTVASGGYRAM